MTYYILRDGRGEAKASGIFRLKRMYEVGDVDASDVVRREGSTGWRTVGDTLGLSFGPTTGGARRDLIPPPPPVSWWVTLILGAVSFGYATCVIGAIQAVWSRRVGRRLAPVAFAAASVLTPPAHLVWIIRSIIHGQHEFREAVVHLLAGFVVAEVAAIVFTALGSLSVRRSLVRKLEESGFRMSWILTALFGPVYVAFALDELRNSYR